MYFLYIIVLKIKLITNLHALSVAIHVLSHKMSCYTLGTFQSQTNFSKEGLKGLVYLTEIHKQNTCTGNCHLK